MTSRYSPTSRPLACTGKEPDHMPRRRRTVAAPVAALQKDRAHRRHPMDSPVPPPTICAAHDCRAEADPDSPVTLCGKHIREVWQYAQGVIADHLLIAAASLIE